jgi:hypothetical protein
MSFPITCTACHKTFTISDEIYEKKVAGRVVTIKCKSCSQGIKIDGTKGTGSGPAATPAVEPPAAPSEPLWAVDYPDGQDREFTTAQVIAELERGVVNGTTLVWREGMGEWLEVSQVPELAGELTKIETRKKAAAVAVAKAAAAAGPVHKPRAPMPTVTGLGGLPGATAGVRLKATQPSAPEAITPRAPQASPAEAPKPRAQQASSPILPKPPAPTPPPPAPSPMIAAAPAPPTPQLAPPFAFAAPSAPLPAPELKPEMTPPLPASVAKVVSRPPQPQPAFPAAAPATLAFGNVPALVADHGNVEWPEAKRKSPLIIIGVVAAVAVIGVAVLTLGSKEEVPPSAPISALPPSPAAAPPPSPAKLPTSSTTVAQPGAETATGSDPVATAPDQGATPGAGFAELFAAGARKAESKGASVAPTARFDAAATKAPLAHAASDAQACKQSGGPTGKVTVVVTFDPNGKVSSATITEAPFAGTATGACISSALKRAAIAPFSGLPGTVSKTFSIL